MRPTLILALLLIAAAAPAATSTEEVAARIRLRDRYPMERLNALSPTALDDLARAVAPDRLQARAAALLAAGNLEPGYRAPDSNGTDSVQAFLRSELRKLEPAGVRLLGAFQTTFAAPSDARAAAGDGGRLTVGNRTWPVAPLWPNGALPSLCPAAGLTGPLVDAGAAEWRDLDGLDLEADGGRELAPALVLEGPDPLPQSLRVRPRRLCRPRCGRHRARGQFRRRAAARGREERARGHRPFGVHAAIGPRPAAPVLPRGPLG